MVGPILFAIFLITSATGAAPNEPLTLQNPITRVNNFDTQIIVLEDASKFQEVLGEGIELIPHNSVQRGEKADWILRYTVGIPSGIVLGAVIDGYSWSWPHDVAYTLQYPVAGPGGILSCVDIYVRQSSQNGGAYILSGGIGQNNIKIVIYSYNTNYVNYNATAYGNL